MRTPARVELRGIGKSFGRERALDGIDLELRPGELLVLVGPSGCGKSTLLRILAGLEKPSQGQVLIDGRDATALPPAARDLGMVFQDYALYPHLSVRENLAFGLKAHRLPAAEVAERVAKAATLLGLEPFLERRPAALSGGQRQRVAIGRAIAREPSVFLLDEPLSNLDAQLRAATRVELASLHRRIGSTTLYVTHDQEEAMTLADRIAVMDRGRLLQVDSPRTVYHEPVNRFVAEFIGNPGMNLLEGELVRASGGAVFRFGRHSVAISESPESGYWLLGFRAESLRPAKEGERADFEVGLELVENLGPELQLIARAADRRIVFRVRDGQDFRPGQTVPVVLDRARISWFSTEGPQLRWAVRQSSEDNASHYQPASLSH